MIHTADDIIITCWCIFFVVWVVNAYRTKVTAEKQSLASTLAHRIPVMLGSWLLLIPDWSPLLNRVLSRQILPRTGSSALTGAALCMGGLAFCIWARYTLAGNWSSDVTFKQDHELIRTGPYHWARHPIYTGLLAMFLGTAIHIGQLRGALSVLLIAIGFSIKLRQEERLLLSHFPDSYPIYRMQTKALIPFVL